MNYVLSEVKHPQRTLKVALPLAVGGVTILYMLANIAYFSAIPKSELAKSEIIIAGIFFRNIFGDGAAARTLPVFVALSNLGNVLAVSFAHARLNQEFGKEGLLPATRFWGSSKPFNTPAAGLFLHWIVTVIVLVAPPAGPAYNFIVDLYTYPGTWINAFVAGGLIWLQHKPAEKWSSPFRTFLPVTVVYLLSNVFLAIVPFIPPDGSFDSTSYPYYVFPIVGVGVLLLGVLYWLVWLRLLPRLRGYEIESERMLCPADGQEIIHYRKVRTSDGQVL